MARDHALDDEGPIGPFTLEPGFDVLKGKAWRHEPRQKRCNPLTGLRFQSVEILREAANDGDEAGKTRETSGHHPKAGPLLFWCRRGCFAWRNCKLRRFWC